MTLDVDECFRDTCEYAFNDDPKIAFKHEEELAKRGEAWKNAKVQTETKSKGDAVNTAHGELVLMMNADCRLGFLDKGTQEPIRNQQSRHALPAQLYDQTCGALPTVWLLQNFSQTRQP